MYTARATRVACWKYSGTRECGCSRGRAIHCFVTFFVTVASAMSS